MSHWGLYIILVNHFLKSTLNEDEVLNNFDTLYVPGNPPIHVTHTKLLKTSGFSLLCTIVLKIGPQQKPELSDNSCKTSPIVQEIITIGDDIQAL